MPAGASGWRINSIMGDGDPHGPAGVSREIPCFGSVVPHGGAGPQPMWRQAVRETGWRVT